MAHRFKIALVQLLVTSNKQENIKNAVNCISAAAKNDAKVVVLPECFNSPYGVKYFPEYSEQIPNGETTDALSNAAKENNVFLVGGSIPERDGDQLYNTCPIFDQNGNLVAKHHIPRVCTFRESDSFVPGNALTILDTTFCKIGVGICHDIRFPELSILYAQLGCSMVLYPGAFNHLTGSAHWQLLLQTRAIDSQIYVAGVSTASDSFGDYRPWGHTTCITPYGDIKAKAGFDQEIVYAEIDLDKLAQTRTNLPYQFQKRNDLYAVKSHGQQ